MSNTFAYVSSWKKKDKEPGLTGYRYDENAGRLEKIEEIEPKVNFNVTYYDRKRCLLYALAEEEDLPGFRVGGGGRIFVFKIDPDEGTLSKIDCKPLYCSSPSNVTIDKSGKYLLVSNHGSKNYITTLKMSKDGESSAEVLFDEVGVFLYSLNEDGTLDRLLDFCRHEGNGPEKRQLHACPHTVTISPDGRLFAVCDKGNDTTRFYSVDEGHDSLVCPARPYQYQPGTLPRYCVFHPVKYWFYNNCENNTYLEAFEYDINGNLTHIGSYNAVTLDQKVEEITCEQQGIVIDHRGRYIYDIVRGQNVVAVFAINQDDGSLMLIQNMKIQGHWPRGCALSPDGRFLSVCCHDSGKVITYGIGTDGKLYETEMTIENRSAAYITYCKL